MRLRKNYLRLFVGFIALLFTLNLTAQTTQPATTPKKGKLVINQDAEISAIVYNKKSNASASPAKPADKKAKDSKNNKDNKEKEAKPTSTPNRPTEQPKESDKKGSETSKVTPPSPNESNTSQRNAVASPADKSEEQKAISERKETERQERERTEEADRGYRAGVVRTRYKARGFRIQLYTGGNTRNHKAQAYSIAGKARQIAPELSSYVQFQSPHWICRVGDFRNREDANRYARRLRSAGIASETRVVSCEVLLAN